MLLVAKNIISDSNLFFYLYNFSQSTTFEYNSAGSLVLPGVHIGKGAIIAAFSLVNKDIPDGEVWGGVPAHKICNRNELEEKFNSNEYKDIKYDSLSPHEKTLTRESIIEELHNNRFCYLV